jgi:16S rRNA (guanine(966)-N(2))-methyltransferase RsmD
VRIISGIWKGRRLISPKGMDVRPTSDKVKEAVFNIIRTRITGSRALDLFAGTGSLGLELLSRGGVKVVFVEKNPIVLSVLKMNCNNMASPDQYEVIPLDSFDAIKTLSSKEKPFDIIFIDPPYKSELLSKALNALSAGSLLVHEGIAVAEHDQRDFQPDIIGNLVKIYERRFGNTGITLYKRG